MRAGLNYRTWSWMALLCIMCMPVMILSGCYKELPPQERAQTPTQPVAAPPAEKTVAPTPGVTPPPSSALGAAKRSASNTVQQAEQASQRTAETIGSDDE